MLGELLFEPLQFSCEGFYAQERGRPETTEIKFTYEYKHYWLWVWLWLRIIVHSWCEREAPR